MRRRNADSGTVTLTVPAASALTFTSAELEAGGDGPAGRLGVAAARFIRDVVFVTLAA